MLVAVWWLWLSRAFRRSLLPSRKCSNRRCEAHCRLVFVRSRTLDIAPEAGKLVVFDSVSLPHEVLPVTASRQRIATTGWFHETSQFSY